VERYYEDIGEMIRKEKLDVASVCTSANVRLGVVQPLIENNINVLVEKPFAMSVAEAEKMVSLKEKFGVQLTVGHNWLFSYMMKKILSKLDKEELGDILSVELQLLHTKDDPMAASSTHWCHSIEAGRFGELLPHPIYIFRKLLGNIETRYVFGSKQGGYSWMPIDELRVLFANPAGRTASVYVSFNSSLTETTFRVVGTKGTLSSNLSTNLSVEKTCSNISVKGIMTEDFQGLENHVNSRFPLAFAVLGGKYKGAHNEFMKAFKNSLIHNTEPPVTAKEALEVVKLHSKLCATIHEQYPP
jgi:predicted dehydrogenase